MPIVPPDILTSKILANPNSLSNTLEVAVNPVAGLNPQPPPSDGDSYYIVSYLEGPEYKYTVLFHLIVLHAIPAYGIPAPGAALLGVSVLDESVAARPVYHPFTEVPDPGLARTIVSPTGLDIRVKDAGGSNVIASLCGAIDAMTITANLPAPIAGDPPLDLELEMKAYGPILNYLGAGIIPFPEGFDYEYALPWMITEGTLSLNGAPRNVAGKSWLDREWGKFAPAQWTWMSIQLGNGVQIALWDQQALYRGSSKYVGGRAFATILHCNGDLSVAPVTIVEAPINPGDDYPQSWKVTISDRARLTVETLVRGQQIASAIVPRMEAKCSVGGTYEEHDVDVAASRAFVEVAKILLP